MWSELATTSIRAAVVTHTGGTSVNKARLVRIETSPSSTAGGVVNPTSKVISEVLVIGRLDSIIISEAKVDCYYASQQVGYERWLSQGGTVCL